MEKDIAIKNSNVPPVVIDRMERANELLMNFIISYVQKITATSELYGELKSSLLKDLRDDTLSAGAKLQLLSILSRHEVDADANLLNALTKQLAQSQTIMQQQSPVGSDVKKEESNVTQKDIDMARDMYDILNELQKSEFFKKATEEKGE